MVRFPRARDPPGRRERPGPQGPPGTVTCNAGLLQIVCNLVVNGQLSIVHASAELTRRGHVLGRSTPKRHRGRLVITFRAGQHLAPGRYTLIVILRDRRGHRYVTKTSVVVRR